LEIFGITFFIQMLGRVGDLELAVSNIVLAISTLAFLPMVGFHIGNATLVGQAVGRGSPEDGVYSTASSLHLTLAYMLLLAAAFVLKPEPLLQLFHVEGSNTARSAEIMDLGIILMRFVAVFCFFDALNLIFSSAIKGAGDTKFIMWTIAALSLGVMITPVYIAVEVAGAGVYTAWTLATVYISALGVAFMLRFRQGRWKAMRVIEHPLQGADAHGA
jgi:MATE family multidrug resistance protein